MNRLYVVESSATLTGTNADHRLAVKPGQVETFARAVAGRYGRQLWARPQVKCPGKMAGSAVADLKNAGRAALVVAGERQPPAVHALACAINQALGAIGTTINLSSQSLHNAGDANATLKSWWPTSTAGRWICSHPGRQPGLHPLRRHRLPNAMEKARQSIYLGYYNDETAASPPGSIPAAHYMEMWGDARAFRWHHHHHPTGHPTAVRREVAL